MRSMTLRLALVGCAVSMYLGMTANAAAEEIIQLAVAENLTSFGSGERLDGSQLDAISGFGVDQQSGPNPTSSGDVSVILFDELGQPRQDGISAGTGANSTVSHSVNVGVGR